MIYLIISSVTLVVILGLILWAYHRGAKSAQKIAEARQYQQVLVSLNNQGKATGKWIEGEEKLLAKGEGLKRENREIFARGPDVDPIVGLLGHARGKPAETPEASKAGAAK